MSTPKESKPWPRVLREALIIYAVAFFSILALALLSGSVGVIAANLYAIVAAVFIGLPYLWMERAKLDPSAFGLHTNKFLRDVGIGLVATIITFIPFAAGQYVWESQVRGLPFEFSVSNWYKLPLELEGEPEEWGDVAGAWAWSEKEDLFIGVRSQVRHRGRVILTSAEDFRPTLIGGSALVRTVGPEGRRKESPDAAKKWEILPTTFSKKVIVRLQHDEAGGLPDDLKIEAERADGYEDKPFDLWLGPTETAHQGAYQTERSITWLLLWAITQIFFIALPEEYFYRGYLLTRLGQAFRARAGAQRSRRVLGITPENLLASFLFGIGHLLIPVGGVLLASRFSVFFPSLLFGWLREKTGGITASVVYHAGCNMMVLVMAVHYG